MAWYQLRARIQFTVSCPIKECDPFFRRNLREMHEHLIVRHAYTPEMVDQWLTGDVQDYLINYVGQYRPGRSAS